MIRNPSVKRVVAACAAVGLIVTLAPPVEGQASKWALRSEAMGKGGVVASGHPLASLAGIKMLAKGGNAIDAIVAMAAALNAVEPEMSGLGGVGFMVLYSAKENRVRTLSFGGRAPAAAKLELFTRDTTTTGPKAPLVPGNLAGWAKALKDYGTMPLSDVLQPAIEYAEQGVFLTPFQAGSLETAAPRIAQFPDGASIYLKNGKEPYKEGELVTNKPLAATMKKIAVGGTDVFYKGELAQTFAQAFERDGGLIRASDFAAFPETVQWKDPLSITYKGHTIYAVPPPNSGVQTLQTLKVMEGFDVKRMGHNTVEYLTHLMETIRLNRLDTDKYVADPRTADVPVKMLLSDEYIATRRAEVIERLKSRPSALGRVAMLPALPPRDQLNESTTHLTAVDRWGNAVNITQTLGSGYGSGYMPGKTGVMFTNAAHWFNLTPGHPNVLAASKDVEWCIAPIQVHKNGKPYFVGGSPGSYGILQTVPQVILNVLEFGMNVQDAIGAPRFRWVDDVDDPLPARKVRMETRIPAEVIKELQARGYDIELLGDWSPGVGGAAAVLADWTTGWLRGGADPRRSGHALGW